MIHWKIQLKDKEVYFYSGDTAVKAAMLYEMIFDVKPISVKPDDGISIKREERERFSVPLLKVIIAGGRDIDKLSYVKDAIEKSGFRVGEVVSGAAQGVDTMGEYWAEKNGIPVKQFPADWAKHGKRAGILRNIEMSEYADALILVWNGQSPGSASMLSFAQKKNMPIYQSVVVS